MASILRGIKYLLHNRAKFCENMVMKYFRWLPDKLYLSFLYRAKMGCWIDWKNPQNFTEKIQWLKVYYRDHRFVVMVDKYAVKEYVSKRIGDEYVISTLGCWNSFDEIDFEQLPNQFVLKTTHGGGGCGVVICKDKKTFDYANARKVLTESLKCDIYKNFREWPYCNVPRRILVEKFMKDEASDSDDLIDYKFFCFNGEPLYCQVIRDRRTKETIDFYDMNWIHMPFVGLNRFAENGKESAKKPLNFDSMVKICRELSSGIPFVRIDLYNISNNPYFGEMTFFPASGFGSFSPSEWNLKLGGLIQI